MRDCSDKVGRRSPSSLPSKLPPPAGGGERGVPHQHFGAFSWESVAGAVAGCENRGSRVLGGHCREKLKLLLTTSKLVV